MIISTIISINRKVQNSRVVFQKNKIIFAFDIWDSIMRRETIPGKIVITLCNYSDKLCIFNLCREIQKRLPIYD